MDNKPHKIHKKLKPQKFNITKVTNYMEPGKAIQNFPPSKYYSIQRSYVGKTNIPAMR